MSTPWIDLSAPVVVPPLKWHTETDPHELAECEALQWITADYEGFALRIRQSALEENGEAITLRIFHERYDDPGWEDTVDYATVEEAQQAGVATIESTLNGENVRVAVLAGIPDVPRVTRWTVVTCPIVALGNVMDELRAITARLPEWSNGMGVAYRAPVIVVDSCLGFEAGCATWSHLWAEDREAARREHRGCEHELAAAIQKGEQ